MAHSRANSLVHAAQTLVDNVATQLKLADVSSRSADAGMLGSIILNSVLSVTVAGAMARVAVGTAGAVLTKLGQESAKSVAQGIGRDGSVSMEDFIDIWKLEQGRNFLDRLLELWHQEEGAGQTDLEQALARIDPADVGQLHDRLMRGVLSAFLESRRKSRGFFDLGSTGWIHIQMTYPDRGSVSCRMVGLSSGNLRHLNAAVEDTGVDPLRFGESGLPVVLTIYRPVSEMDVKTIARRGHYLYENWWIEPHGTGGGGGRLTTTSKRLRFTSSPAMGLAPPSPRYTSRQDMDDAATMRRLSDFVGYYMTMLPVPEAFGDDVAVKHAREVMIF